MVISQIAVSATTATARNAIMLGLLEVRHVENHDK